MRLSASDSGLKRLWHWMSAYDPKQTSMTLRLFAVSGAGASLDAIRPAPTDARYPVP